MYTDQLMGRQIDAFTVQERIGKGGMASVYRAYQASINRSVALKVIALDPTVSERDEFQSRFALEAQTIAALEHIHVLPIYDYGIFNNELAYIAMRLLRGGTLADMLSNGPIDVEHAADIFTQVARGLNYAHSKGVIHRDLKPSNIMFDESGNAYLTDFGLAKMVENSVHLTKSGNIVGTPAYMSPEQLRGDAIDYRSDIYGMACILYHMLVGHPPFEASEANMVSVIYQHLEKAPIPPSQLNVTIPSTVEVVILRGLEKDPDARFPTAEAMANALNEALGRKLSTASYPILHTDSKPSINAPRPLSRPDHRLYYAGAAVIALLLLVVAAVVLPRLPLQSLMVEPIAAVTATYVSPTVLDGQVGVSADAVPSSSELQAAKAHLGSSGFIAYVTCNQTSQYHAAQAREMSDLAAADGMKFHIYDSNNDKYAEISQIERARADGVTGLLVCPLDAAALADTLKSVQEAHIPLVLMASNTDNYGGVLIGGDDYLMGLEAGRAAGEIIRDEMNGQADAIILDYPDLGFLVTRANGLQDGVLEIAPQTHIIGRYLGATPDNGQRSVAKLLADGIKFNVILSINDAGSYGAITAMEDANVDPNSVIISSVDAESVARQYIEKSYFMRASVDVGRQKFSETAINAMVKLLAGASVPETYLVPPGQVITRQTLQAEVTQPPP